MMTSLWLLKDGESWRYSSVVQVWVRFLSISPSCPKKPQINRNVFGEWWCHCKHWTTAQLGGRIKVNLVVSLIFIPSQNMKCEYWWEMRLRKFTGARQWGPSNVIWFMECSPRRRKRGWIKGMRWYELKICCLSGERNLKTQMFLIWERPRI